MQFVQPLKTEFQCAICHKAWEPEEALSCTTCEAVFCSLCFGEVLVKDSTCLSCSAENAKFTKVHRLLRSMAAGLEVFCANKPFGCDWKGVRADLTPHLTICTKRPKPFSYVNEKEVPEELICAVCHDPLVEPVQLKCEHLFCLSCAKKSIEATSSCASCRRPATAEDFIAPPKSIISLLDNLPVHCPHKSNSTNPCAWAGRRRDYIGHQVVCSSAAGQPSAKPADPLSSSADIPKTPKVETVKLESVTEYPNLIRAAGTEQDVYVLAHLVAPELETVGQRKKPLAISAVIDISGSMRGAKLDMAKESLKFMINELGEKDELGIIAFESQIHSTLLKSKMTFEGKESAKKAVDSLSATGCTNLSGGLLEGLRQIEGRPFAGGQGGDLTLTDKVTPAKVRFADPSSTSLSKVAPTTTSNASSSASTSSFFGRLFSSRPTATTTSSPTPMPPVPAVTTPVALKPRPAGKISLDFWCTQVKRDGKTFSRYSVDASVGVARVVEAISLSFGEGTSASVAEVALNPDRTQGAMSLEAPSVFSTVKVTVTFRAGEFYHGPQSSFTRVLPLDPVEHQNRELLIHPTSLTPPVDVESKLEARPRNRESTHCNAVLLFTDGAANEGISDPDRLCSVFKSWLSASNEDVVLHTFGFGADHNATLLNRLSEIGSGSYYFIKDTSVMKESFADCLGGLLSTVAEHITLDVCPTSDFQLIKIHTTLKLQENPDNTYTIKMRDVYSGEKRDVLVQLRPRHVPASTSAKEASSTLVSAPRPVAVVNFVVRYSSLISGNKEAVTTLCEMPWSDATRTESPNILVDQQRQRIAAAEAIEAARKLADSGNMEAARKELQNCTSAMRAAPSAGSSYVEAMMDEMRDLDQLCDTATWQSQGSKMAAQVSTCHQQQRWNQPTTANCAAFGYDNSVKKAMRFKSSK